MAERKAGKKKYPKKPKAKKLPKKPKASASLQVWARWKQRVDETIKGNQRALKDWEAAKKKADEDDKKKKKIMQYNPKLKQSRY